MFSTKNILLTEFKDIFLKDGLAVYWTTRNVEVNDEKRFTITRHL